MVNTFEQAMAKARAQHKPGLFPTGQCLMRVRMLFGVPAKWGTAAEAWAKAKQKHTGPPSEAPAGSIGFWTGGTHGFGHVAPMLGGGLCDSTDFVNRGGFGICHADDITVGWRLRWAGYTYDLNGVTVYVPPEPRKPPTPAPVHNHVVKGRQLLAEAVAELRKASKKRTGVWSLARDVEDRMNRKTTPRK